jgi:hypothetical protein
LALAACGQPGVELVQRGSVVQNPTVPVGLAIGKNGSFREVVWEQYVDQHGVMRVLATGQYHMDLPEIAKCPASQGGMVKAKRLFLRMVFTVDRAMGTFSFDGSEFLAYSKKGWSHQSPGGVTAFEAVLNGDSGVDCDVLYAPG